MFNHSGTGFMTPVENLEINLWWVQRNLNKQKSRKSLIPEEENERETSKWEEERKEGREGEKEGNPVTFCSSAVNTYIVIIM